MLTTLISALIADLTVESSCGPKIGCTMIALYCFDAIAVCSCASCFFGSLAASNTVTLRALRLRDLLGRGEHRGVVAVRDGEREVRDAHRLLRGAPTSRRSRRSRRRRRRPQPSAGGRGDVAGAAVRQRCPSLQPPSLRLRPHDARSVAVRTTWLHAAPARRPKSTNVALSIDGRATSTIGPSVGPLKPWGQAVTPAGALHPVRLDGRVAEQVVERRRGEVAGAPQVAVHQLRRRASGPRPRRRPCRRSACRPGARRSRPGR